MLASPQISKIIVLHPVALLFLCLIFYFILPLSFSSPSNAGSFERPDPYDCEKSNSCALPIVLTPEEARSNRPLVFEAPNLVLPNDILMIDHLLLRVDKYQGIFIYSLEDEQNPLFKYLIPIYGVSDVNLYENYIYAQTFRDLVIIDSNQLKDDTFTPESIIRKEDIFHSKLYECINTQYSKANDRQIIENNLYVIGGYSASGDYYTMFCLYGIDYLKNPLGTILK